MFVRKERKRKGCPVCGKGDKRYCCSADCKRILNKRCEHIRSKKPEIIRFIQVKARKKPIKYSKLNHELAKKYKTNNKFMGYILHEIYAGGYYLAYPRMSSEFVVHMPNNDSEARVLWRKMIREIPFEMVQDKKRKHRMLVDRAGQLRERGYDIKTIAERMGKRTYQVKDWIGEYEAD